MTPHTALPTHPQLRIADMRVDLMTPRDALAELHRVVSDPPSTPVAWGSINLDHLHHFGIDRQPLHSHHPHSSVHWRMMADGWPIAAIAAHRTGRRWPRMTGADLLPVIITYAARHHRRLGFLGGAPAMHTALREHLHETYPTLPVSGMWAPERAELADPNACAAMAARVREASTDILIVGLGKPRQEQWIDTYGGQTGASLIAAFGAAADFVAGRVPRAPSLVRTLGLEWGYRLVQEPRRLARRYLVQGPRAATLLLDSSTLPTPPSNHDDLPATQGTPTDAVNPLERAGR